MGDEDVRSYKARAKAQDRSKWCVCNWKQNTVGGVRLLFVS